MENRREFLKKAGIAGGLGTAGALTLRKEYVKPVVKLLEPGAAYAQTPALSVGAGAWSTAVLDMTPPPGPPAAVTLTLTVDLPGGSAPIPGSTYNAFLSMTPLQEPSGWATGANIAVGSTVNSNTIDNAGTGGPGGVVQFAYLWPGVGTLNGVAITPPPAPGNYTNGAVFLQAGATGDRARVCLHVDADAGSTIGGTAYPAQVLGFWCFEWLWS
jgi:hypothetical protein